MLPERVGDILTPWKFIAKRLLTLVRPDIFPLLALDYLFVCFRRMVFFVLCIYMLHGAASDPRCAVL